MASFADPDAAPRAACAPLVYVNPRADGAASEIVATVELHGGGAVLPALPLHVRFESGLLSAPPDGLLAVSPALLRRALIGRRAFDVLAGGWLWRIDAIGVLYAARRCDALEVRFRASGERMCGLHYTGGQTYGADSIGILGLLRRGQVQKALLAAMADGGGDGDGGDGATTVVAELDDAATAPLRMRPAQRGASIVCRGVGAAWRFEWQAGEQAWQLRSIDFATP